MPTDRGYIREGKGLLQLLQVSGRSGSIARGARGDKGDRVNVEAVTWKMQRP
jgi:hypothetical protein